MCNRADMDNRGYKLMSYNLVMYIGVGLIVFGFLGFIFCEMKEREIDRKIAENQHFIDAILKTQGKK